MSLNPLLDQSFSLLKGSILKNEAVDIIVSLVNDEASQKAIAARINREINSSFGAVDQFKVLNKCLPRFSKIIVAENAENWLRCCIESKESSTKALRLLTLRNIVETLKDNPEFNKLFVTTNFLNRTLDLCIKDTANCAYRSEQFKCLITCLKNYGSSCGSYQKKIEDVLFNSDLIFQENLVHLTGAVLFHLQLIGNAGRDNSTHINNLTSTIRLLCATSHKLFSELLEDEIEFEEVLSNDVRTLDVAIPIHLDDESKLKYKATALRIILKWITVLLEKKHVKVIYPSEILNVIKRGLALHQCVNNKTFRITPIHNSLQMKVTQISLIGLLQVLIQQMGPLLIPFYHEVSKIILDLITRTQNCECFVKDDIFRAYLYETLTIWLKNGGDFLKKAEQEKIIVRIIEDSFPATPTVSLKLNAELIGKSSKFKQKSFSAKFAAPEKAPNVEDVSSKVCTDALKTLRILLECSDVVIDTKLLNTLYTKLIGNLVSIQNDGCLMDNNEGVIILYELVVAFYEQDNVKILPPIQTVLNLLSRGLTAKNRQVVEVCTRGLNVLEKICQPACSSLYISYHKNVSDENISTMESIIDENISTVESIIDEKLDISADDKMDKEVNILSQVIIQSSENDQRDNEINLENIDEEVISIHSNQDEEVVVEVVDVLPEKQVNMKAVLIEDVVMSVEPSQLESFDTDTDCILFRDEVNDDFV